LSRSHSFEHCELGDDPQLRLFRRRRNVRVHLGLHGGVRLRSCDARARIRGRRRPHLQTRVAGLRRPRILFVCFLAEIAYVSRNFESSLYAEEWNIFDFLKQPDVTLLQALLLKFKPVNMDVLPLYIVLLLGFPAALWLLLRRPSLALIASAALYCLARTFEWNIPAYPSGEWVFNPLAWQFLFVIGAWLGVGGTERIAGLIRSRIVAAPPA